MPSEHKLDATKGESAYRQWLDILVLYVIGFGVAAQEFFSKEANAPTMPTYADRYPQAHLQVLSTTPRPSLIPVSSRQLVEEFGEDSAAGGGGEDDTLTMPLKGTGTIASRLSSTNTVPTGTSPPQVTSPFMKQPSITLH